MKFMKRTAVITLAIVLVINMNTNVFAKAGCGAERCGRVLL